MKKKTAVRGLLAVMLLAAMLVSLASCAEVRPIKSREGELDVIGTVGRFDIYYEELRYITLNCKSDMEIIHGVNIWDDAELAEQYRAELYDRVYGGIASDYYGVLAMADQLYATAGGADGMLAEEEIKSAVQDTINETVEESGGKAEYREALEANYMTDHLYRFYVSVEMAANELFFIARDDLGLLDDSDEYAKDYMHSDKFIRTNHVYLEGRTEENLKLAQQIEAQLKASDSPESELILLKGRYCADWKMTTTHGYYFAHGNSDCGDEYEDTAFAMNVGDVSGIVESDTGYYVIMRLAKEESYMTESFDEFKTQIIGTDFNDLIAKARDGMTLTLNEYGRSVDLVAMK